MTSPMASSWETVGDWRGQHIGPDAPPDPQPGDLWLDPDDDAGADVPGAGIGELTARVDTLEQAPPAHAGRHAAGGADPLTPGEIGAAADTAVVHTTGAETISGLKTFVNGVAVAHPSAANMAVRHDDPRLSDARTPTAHGHSPASIGAATADHTHSGYATVNHGHSPGSIGAAAASHTHTSADVTRTIGAQTSVGNGGTATPAAAADVDRFTTTGSSATLATPSGTAVDGAVVNVEVYSTGSTTNLALAGGYTLTGGQSSPVAVPSGKAAHLALRYRAIAPAGWRILAVSVDN